MPGGIRFKDDQEQRSAKPRLGGVFLFLPQQIFQSLFKTAVQIAEAAQIQADLVTLADSLHRPQ